MATNAEKLVEAEAALHALITGTKARVVVDQNGERVEFTATSISKLQAYIEYLKGLINGNGPGSRRPMRVWGT